jgi:hypothetical protein
VVSVADPLGRNLGFIDRCRYFSFQVAPQLYSRGWVGPVPDPLLLRKSGSAGNRTRTTGSVARNSDHRGGPAVQVAHKMWRKSSPAVSSKIQGDSPLGQPSALARVHGARLNGPIRPNMPTVAEF